MITILAASTLTLAAEQAVLASPNPLRWSPDTSSTASYTLRSDLTWTESGARDFDKATSQSLDYFRPGLPFRNFDLTAQMDCGFTSMSADRLAIDCVIDGVQLGSDQARRPDADDVLGALASRIDGAQVTAVLSERGRLRDLDVEWADEGWRSWDHVAEELVLRAMAGFDLELPLDATASQWDQRQSAFVGTATATGPLARSELVHERRSTIGDTTLIHSAGRLSHLVFEAGVRPTDVGRAQLQSAASFDSREGLLVDRVWAIRGSGETPFLQEGSLRLIR